MSIPSKAVGYGSGSIAQNVFNLTFSTALSSAPKYEAYDGGAYPAVGAAITVANTVFAGTAGNGNKPMLSLVATSNAAPASNWLPAAATGGSANPNRMKGQTNFVTDPSTPGAAGAIRWNEVLEVPSDATTGSTMAVDLLIRYTYTGGAPALTWAYNEGTEGVPIWTPLTPGTHGLRHCRTGTVGGGPYLANIPASSVELTTEGWVAP